MSKKARRRPSWRKNPVFYVHLINSETGELFETLRFKKNNAVFFRMMKKHGPEEMEKILVQGMINLADRTLNDHSQVSL